MNTLDQPTRHPHRERSVPPIALRARDVADLTVAAGFPCISVLLPTQSAPRMTPGDFERLHSLIAAVDRALRERGVISRARLMEKLQEEVRRVTTQPTDRALAIYVSLALTRSFRLPQPVEPRAVVEQTFATRPLVSALHRMPPHVVLVLHPTCAHLYAAADGGLHPVGQVDPFRGSGRIKLPGPGDPGAEEARSDLNESYLRAVDAMLGDYRAEHPSPLVLAGSARLLDRFCGVSRNLGRLAGRLGTGQEDTALDLALACTETIEKYLRNRRQDAMEQLTQAMRVRPADVAAGIEDCWRTVQSRAPGMLLVEDSFISPGIAVTGSAGKTTQVVTEPVHDLVDDLIEQVILRGGQIALVRDGDLESHARVALISRARRP
jgi:hypothetical protein